MKWGYSPVLCLTVLLAACGGAGLAEPAPMESPSTRVTLIIPDQQDDYFRAIRNGAIEAAVTENIQLTIPPDASTAPAQIAAITSAIERGDSGIAIAPVSTEVDAALSVARNAGLKVVNVGGTAVDVANVDLTVQTDDCVLGLAAGQWLSGRLPEGSIFWPDFNAHFLRVIGSTGEYPRPTCRDEAWLQGLGIDPALVTGTPPGAIPAGTYAGGGVNFDIPCTVIFQGDLKRVTEEVRTCVLKHPEINAAYASSGELARAAGDGLRFAGKTVGVDVLMTTVGGTGQAMDLAQGSWVNATARPRVSATGGSAIMALSQLVRGQQPDIQGDKTFVDTGVDLCTDDPKTAVFVAVTMPIRDCVARLSELD